MSHWFVAAVLYGPLLSPLVFADGAQGRLQTAARASPRPSVCAPTGSFWNDHATLPEQFCARLGHGYSALSRQPQRSLRIAEELLKGVGHRTDAALLAARASVALRDFPAALAFFRSAEIDEPEKLLDVAALHDYALALAANRDAKAAVRAYRLLLPRADLLTLEHDRRLRAIVEGAVAVMRVSRQGAEDAAVFLAPYAERPQYRGMDVVVRAALRLSRQRAGAGRFAEALSVDAGEQLSHIERSSANAPWLFDYEWAALQAVSYHDVHPELAVEAWQRYLELAPPDDLYREHAASELRRLGGSLE